MLSSRSSTATCTWKRFMVSSFTGWGGCTGAATAAVLREVADELVHVLEVRAVEDEAAFLADAHETGAGEVREVKRERGGRQLELLADATGGEPFGPGSDQQAIRHEARLLRQGGERVDDLRHFHISRIMEITRACQARCQPPGVRVKTSLAATTKSAPVQPKRSMRTCGRSMCSTL